MVKANPNSFLRVNKSEVDFDPDTSPYSDEVYKKGKENLQRLINEQIMIRDEQPCFYLYRLTWLGQSQTGLIATTSVDEYARGLIKKHEHTRPEKVNDRANHIQTLEAQVGPVFSIFRQNEKITSLFKEFTAAAAEVDFTGDDSVRHELWIVSDEGAVKALVGAFADVGELYIADGHHRSESALEVSRRMKETNPNHTGDEPYNFFLNVLFSDTELRILPYNRAVSELNGLTVEDLLAKAGESYTVEASDQPVEPDKKQQVGLYCAGKWYRLTSKEGSFDKNHAARSIDSAVLSENFLAPILGIENIRTDKRIDFIGGIRGVAELVRLVDSDKFKIAFSLGPVTVDQLLKVADAGEVMPPKSTWFEPKLRSGMVVNLLNE